MIGSSIFESPLDPEHFSETNINWHTIDIIFIFSFQICNETQELVEIYHFFFEQILHAYETVKCCQMKVVSWNGKIFLNQKYTYFFLK